MDWKLGLGDLKSIQGLSKVLVGPFLIASYIANTGLSVQNELFELSIPDNGTFSGYWHYFLAIFIFKSLQVTICFFIPVSLAKIFKYKLGPDWFFILGFLSLAFAVSGILLSQSMHFFQTLHPSTYYAAIVVGFYFLAEKWPD